MSDASFDTSAADTLTSGLSLGQYIKNVAEEARPSDRWFPLQPTVEKEWHTLQGESVSQNTVVDDEMIELPLSDVSTNSVKQVHLNPVASLIQHSENQKQSENSNQSGQLSHDLSPPLGTPAVSAQASKTIDNYPHDYFTTPALYHRKQEKEKHSFGATSLTSNSHQMRYDKSHNAQLSAEDISSLLEKDDSLAQRVKNLLEDNGSIRSDSSETFPKLDNNQKIPTLLQSTSREKKTSVEKQLSSSTTASQHDEHLALSDASLCSTNEKPTPTTVLNQSNPMLKTLNLFSESGYDMGNLTGISNLGDPLESLNTSAGTEYGELPETVDIPKDIVHRLNNMRLISHQQQSRFNSNANITRSVSNDNSAFIQESSGVAAQCSMPTVCINSSTKPVPISGDVRFHAGSNPTTPQFPIEEEKLKQLQSYIEKKTGLPIVSPLVVNTDGVSMPSVCSIAPSQTTNIPQASEATPITVGVSSTFSSAGTSALLAATPVIIPELDSVRLVSSKQVETTPKPPPSNLQFDSSQRCDPEGMSPPINSTTAPLATNKTAVVDTQSSSKLISNQSALTATEADNLSENLSDESLLARIKSALSDSYSQNPDQLEKSGTSLTSSIDSLAAHVKALLKEEVPNLVSEENHETSNLSEAIENFEHTELWKFVAQFLPAAVPSQMAGSQPHANVPNAFSGDTVKQDPAITNSFSDNSILERIRTELKKSSFREELSEESSTSTIQSEKPEAITDRKLVYTAEKIEQSYDPVETKSPQVQSSNSTRFPVTTTAQSNLHIIDEEPLQMDPIPGIPDFAPSVLKQSSPTGPFLSHHSIQTRSATTQPAKTAWPEKSFSHHKQNAKTMITNQLNRAAHRDFDVSFTPAKHSSVFLSEKPPSSKLDTNASSVRKMDVSVSTAERRSHPRSAYFKQQDTSFASSSTATGNRTYDIARSSRTTPTSTESQVQAESVSSPKTFSMTKSATDFMPFRSAMSSKSTSVTPMVSSGLPSPSKRVTLNEPQRSAPSRYNRQYDSFERSRSGSPIRNDRSRSVEFASPKRRKSPLRDRLTVQDWLKSPERKRKLGEQKYLPTFDELMEKERRELEEKALKEREYQVEKEMRSLQERDLNAQCLRKTRSEGHDPFGSYSDRRSKKLDFEKSSLHPQLDDNDSYQQTSLNTGGLPVAFSRSSLPSEDSDVNIQRRMVNQVSSDTEFKPELTKIPRTVSEFQSMDEKSQQEFLRQAMVWVNRKRRSSTNDKKSRPDSAPTMSTSQSESLLSNNAVCDSDSTEYCDLPSTRPQTANTLNTSSLLGMDEVKAEKLMRKLLERIRRQKESERAERKRTSHKRTAASSSTPQKRRPPLPVPEASSIASTDTDAGGKYYIQLRDRKHPGHRKVAYVEEVSESEPTAFVRIKRKTKKPELFPERIVLHDRSVQTESSLEAGSSQPTSVDENTPRELAKTSKAVQTSVAANIKQKPDVEDKENIGPRRKLSQHQQRFSSFFVDFKNGDKLKRSQPRDIIPAHKSVAWYEPFSYEPCWMDRDDNHGRQTDTKGLVQLTLQEALASQHPEFISKSRERQRRITIHSDERRLQEIWEEERQRVFGKNSVTKPRRSVPHPPPRRNLQLTRKQIVAETREKYEQLPEVVKKREEERRKREYASYRLKAQNYKKKIQSKVLGRYFA